MSTLMTADGHLEKVAFVKFDVIQGAATEFGPAAENFEGRGATAETTINAEVSEHDAPPAPPIIKMATPYEKYFRPTMVTDQSGRLAEDLAEDLWDEVILELRV